MTNRTRILLERTIRRIIQQEILSEEYKESNPKIDLFYKDSKGNFHYLFSSKWSLYGPRSGAMCFSITPFYADAERSD